MKRHKREMCFWRSETLTLLLSDDNVNIWTSSITAHMKSHRDDFSHCFYYHVKRFFCRDIRENDPRWREKKSWGEKWKINLRRGIMYVIMCRAGMRGSYLCVTYSTYLKSAKAFFYLHFSLGDRLDWSRMKNEFAEGWRNGVILLQGPGWWRNCFALKWRHFSFLLMVFRV